MTSASQFRPGPPPALTSALWARDYNEIKALGSKSNSRRTAEQTQIASFWEATLPPIFNGIILSVADIPGREITQNARLFAATAQAADDALLAVFDAKYHYNFWRPVTAIRNGDLDGNDTTERDASWTPFIETPMHPEYPCAHCIVAAAIGTVLQAEVGAGTMPKLTTTSYLVKVPARNWTRSMTSCRKWRTLASTMACTFATQPKSAQPWVNRWRARRNEISASARVAN